VYEIKRGLGGVLVREEDMGRGNRLAGLRFGCFSRPRRCPVSAELLFVLPCGGGEPLTAILSAELFFCRA
jgi:hypothetical protein